MDFPGWPVAAAGELTTLEENWRSIADKLGADMSPGSSHALARAVNVAGLAGARLGADDARIGGWLDAGGAGRAKVQCVPRNKITVLFLVPWELNPILLRVKAIMIATALVPMVQGV